MIDRFLAKILAEEVDEIYRGERIRNISYNLYNLRLKFHVDKPSLILSAHPNFYGIVQENKTKGVPGVIGNWVDLTHVIKDIEDLVVVSVVCCDKDRVIYFNVSNNIQIICKFFGRRSNIIITYQYKIIWSLNKFDKVGNRFVEPEEKELPSVYDVCKEGFLRTIKGVRSGQSYKVISSILKEITPDTAKFLIEYICLPLDIRIDKVSDEKLIELSRVILDYCNAYKKKEVNFRILRGMSGVYYLSPLVASDCMEQIGTEETSALGVLQRHNELLEKMLVRDSIVRQAYLEIKRKRERLESKIKRAEERLENAKLYSSLRKMGDILMANLGMIKKGSESVILPDSSVEGNRIEISLDPSLSPYENAVVYYKNAKKMERALNRIPDEIERLKFELEELPKPDSVINLGEEELRKIITHKIGFKRVEEKKNKKFLDLHILKVEIRKGAVVYIGRDARSNEYVSFRLAKGNDLWFHAFERHGSHLILRLQKGREPTGDDIITSAKIAGYFSKGRNDSKVEVVYTRAKYIRKTKVIGKVLYSNNKSIIVKPTSIDDLGLRVERL
ncbi:MAG: NFACT RNA binding domain-containing protein [bacterium]